MTASEDAPCADAPGPEDRGKVRRELLAASVLLAVAGVLAIVQGGFIFYVAADLGSTINPLIGLCSMLGLLFGAIAVMAGYGVHVRSGFRFLVVSCVIAVFGVGFFAGSALAFVALYLVGRNRDEFR
ncbi:MAG: hypothetical protein AB1793_02705 [Candidatus Thermoplasmatota archaeon]